jgi:hypothetical protein
MEGGAHSADSTLIIVKRVWCIFECFTAIQNHVEITIVMPPKERERMSKILLGSNDRKDASVRRRKNEPSLPSSPEDESSIPCTLQPSSPCRGGVDALYRTLANISVQDAQATVKEDQIRIMGILRHSQIGFDAVNKKVANYLREWVRRAMDVIVQQQEERMQQAVLDEESKQQDGLPKKRSYRLTHAAFCTNVAMLFQRNGEYDAASM